MTLSAVLLFGLLVMSVYSLFLQSGTGALPISRASGARSPLARTDLIATQTVPASLALAAVPAGTLPDKFLFSIGAQAPVGTFDSPSDVAIAPDGMVYIADAGNDRIQQFTPPDTFVRLWGSTGSSNGRFSWPSNVAVAQDGTVYVADRWNYRIQHFSPDGTFLGQWGSRGTGDGQFSSPAGMAVANDGTVYVVDSSNHLVQRFDAAGRFLSKWGSWGFADGQFDRPQDTAIARDGTLYVVDYGCRVQRFSLSGSFLGKWGGSGNGDGQFRRPSGVAVGPDDTVFVVDAWQGSIQRFTGTGGFLGKWGTWGNGDGQFTFPSGVSIGADGTVYIADGGNDRVQRFSPTGSFLGKWGYQSGAEGILEFPQGIAQAPDDTIYVADTYNHRIQRYSAVGAFVEAWGTEGDDDGQFDAPGDVSIAPDSTVYVADTRNHRIQHFSPTGHFLDKWGSQGNNDGQFSFPSSVAVGPDGTVYVADDNDRIQRFSATGEYLSKWGSSGSGDGQFGQLEGLSVGFDGTVYAADSLLARIQRFSATGGFLGKWGDQGSGNGQFDWPTGVAVAPDGTVFVSDSDNKRIQRFTATGVFLGMWGSAGPDNGQFSSPGDIAVAADGTTYIADGDRIQVFGPTYPATWRAEYFANRWLTERPLFITQATEIDFNWGVGAPEPVLPTDGFSAHFLRHLPLAAGTYRFTVQADDGVRLWVGGRLLVDRWDGPAGTYSGEISLATGDHQVRLEYNDISGPASVRLTWTGGPTPTPTASRTPTPTRTPTKTPTPSPTPTPVIAISHIEITQATQDENNSVPLIAGKPTFVRVYVDCGAGCTSVPGVTGVLEISTLPNASLVPFPRFITAYHVEKWADQRGNLTRTLNFMVDTRLVTGTVTFTARVGGNSLSDVGSFKSARVPRIAYLPIHYDPVLCTWPQQDPDGDRIKRAFQWAQRVYPTTGIEYIAWPGFAWTMPLRLLCDGLPAPVVGEMLLARLHLGWLMATDSRPDYVFGWLPDEARGGGFSLPFGTVAFGDDDPVEGPSLFAHEIGHLLGRWHTNTEDSMSDRNCNHNKLNLAPRGSWPHKTSKIHDYGVDLLAKSDLDRLKRPEDNYDYMSYCGSLTITGEGGTVWTSAWTYAHVYSETLSLPVATMRETSAASQVYMIASGLVYTNGTVTFDPIWMLTSTVMPRDQSTGATYCIEAQNTSGAALRVRCFEPTFIDNEAGIITDVDGFNLILPYSPDVTRIVLKKGATELAVRAVSAHAPAVTVLSPNGGETWAASGTYTITWTASDLDDDPLTYSVLYNSDGNNWVPVGTAITTTQLVVNAADLAGGTAARVRVLATDGVNTSSDESNAAFTVGRKGPSAFILAPTGDVRFMPGTPLWLQGYGYDLEDGTLEGVALLWRSNRDGDLGTGSQALVALSPGRHTITLAATDSHGNTAMANVNVFAGQRAYLPLVMR